MTVPTCNQPSDGDPTTPCPYTTVHGTDRCVQHIEPGHTRSDYHGPYNMGTRSWSSPRTDESEPVQVPARPYGSEDRTPPTPAELREIADGLNRHGGLDERFVAGLLNQVVTDGGSETGGNQRERDIPAPPPARRGWLLRALEGVFG